MDTVIENYKTKLGYQFNLALKTITPLHIGGSDTLSPLSDYYIENRKLHFIDSNKLSQVLEERGKTETYITRTVNAAEEEKSGFLQKFFNTELQLPLNQCRSAIAYPVYIQGNPVELNQCIKSNGNPVIPGSSVKGFIRSAMLYNWLMEGSPESRAAIDQWSDELFKVYDKDLPVRDKVQQLEDSFRMLVEEKLFGKVKVNDGTPLAMSCFKVSDSRIIQNCMLGIYEMQRFSLYSGQGDIPVLKECIEPAQMFNFNIAVDYHSISSGMQESYVPLLSAFTNPGHLCKVINSYSRAALHYEIATLDGAVHLNKLNDYKKWLVDIKDSMQNAERLTAYFRLGQGKAQFFQTIAMALFEKYGATESNDEWLTYLSYCAAFPQDGVTTPYPLTRSLTATQQKPLGWVEMRVL